MDPEKRNYLQEKKKKPKVDSPMKQLHEYILCNMMQKSCFFSLQLLCLTMKEYKMHPENWENYEAHQKTNVYVQYFFYIFGCWSESESTLNTHAHVE